jgi:hypothetical protein
MGLEGTDVSFAVQAALGNDPRFHIKPLGTDGIAFWALFTVIWAVQVIRLRRSWAASPPLASFSAQARSTQLNFRRQAPTALILGAFIIPLGWLIILFPNAGWVIAPALILPLLSLLAFLIVVSVWFFHRPRRSVPPNLRDVR